MTSRHPVLLISFTPWIPNSLKIRTGFSSPMPCAMLSMEPFSPSLTSDWPSPVRVLRHGAPSFTTQSKGRQPIGCWNRNRCKFFWRTMRYKQIPSASIYNVYLKIHVDVFESQIIEICDLFPPQDSSSFNSGQIS